MDYDYIEALVTKFRNNDELSKEKLAQEFRPLIEIPLTYILI